MKTEINKRRYALSISRRAIGFPISRGRANPTAHFMPRTQQVSRDEQPLPICRSVPGATFPRLDKLAKLSPGNTTWTEEESRRNFDTVSQLVTPGDPLGSTLLHHPLAPEAGGDAFHSGGRQFESQNDPDWQTLADWVRGRKSN
jgi:hypothetical protein